MSYLGPSVALRQALAESLTSGSFIDTKFYVFSRRNSSKGRVDKPRALYANSTVLKQGCSYFGPMLSGGNFSEAALKDMEGGFPEDEIPYVEDYDYFSDSDLEDEEGEEEDATHTGSSVEEAAEITSDNSSMKADAGTTNSPRLGQVIIIKDTAFLTFSALLEFIHTGDIGFGTFGRHNSISQTQHDSPPRPSPKSIYRLADKYGMEGLKSLAYENIQRNLPSCDIVEEIFSEFTSWYPNIRELEVCATARAIRRDAALFKKFVDKLEKFGHGDFSYSSESLVALMNVFVGIKHDHNKEVISRSPSEGFWPVTLTYWTDVKKAINTSLHSGRFIDAKIYAHPARSHSSCKTPVQSLPLYFSRVAMNACYRSLSNPLLNTSSTVESDCDSDCDLEANITPGDHLKSAGAEASRGVCLLAEGSENQPDSAKYAWEGRTVANESTLHMSVGASRTWKCVLYYIYTDDISFAPLRSQDSKSRLNEISCERRDSTIPPCSPKSVYSIAEMFGLQELKNLAHENIVSKVGQDNVVEEIFSKFSSSHPTILTKVTEILSQHCQQSTTIPARLSDTIRATAGRDSHHSEALKSVFGMLISKRPTVEMKCRSCSFVGSKSDFLKRHNRCPRFSEVQLCCACCNFSRANFNYHTVCSGCDSIIAS